MDELDYFTGWLTRVYNHYTSVSTLKDNGTAEKLPIVTHLDLEIDDCERLITWLEELKSRRKYMENTAPCCPYDYKECDKTECFINDGPCSRRIIKQDKSN